jgi:hypothetical protein
VNQEHFYHVGAMELNRNAIKEALVMNYESVGEVWEAERTPDGQRALAFV